MAVVLAALVLFLGARPARAVDTDNQNKPPVATDTEATPADDTDKPVADQPAAEAPAAPAVPQLQLSDEGPSARGSDSDRLSRSRIAADDDAEERPFWKNWIFWAVTGALVVGTVGMAIYMQSGTDASLAPCPPDVVVSLGCFGTGR